MRTNKMKPSEILEICLYAVIGILLVCVFLKAVRSEQNAQPLLEGMPLEYIQEDPLLRLSIDQIASDESRVYVLFDKYEGIVQIYSTEGVYEKTLAFSGSTNGAFKIAVKNAVLYVCDKTGNLYLFEDGTFLEFIKRSDGEAMRKDIDFESNSARYVLRWGSVWDVSGEKAKCIIHRPVSTILSQGNLITVLGIGTIFIIGITRRKPR